MFPIMLVMFLVSCIQEYFQKFKNEVADTDLKKGETPNQRDTGSGDSSDQVSKPKCD